MIMNPEAHKRIREPEPPGPEVHRITFHKWINNVPLREWEEPIRDAVNWLHGQDLWVENVLSFSELTQRLAKLTRLPDKNAANYLVFCNLFHEWMKIEAARGNPIPAYRFEYDLMVSLAVIERSMAERKAQREGRKEYRV